MSDDSDKPTSTADRPDTERCRFLVGPGRRPDTFRLNDHDGSLTVEVHKSELGALFGLARLLSLHVPGAMSRADRGSVETADEHLRSMASRGVGRPCGHGRSDYRACPHCLELGGEVTPGESSDPALDSICWPCNGVGGASSGATFYVCRFCGGTGKAAGRPPEASADDPARIPADGPRDVTAGQAGAPENGGDRDGDGVAVTAWGTMRIA